MNLTQAVIFIVAGPTAAIVAGTIERMWVLHQLLKRCKTIDDLERAFAAAALTRALHPDGGMAVPWKRTSHAVSRAEPSNANAAEIDDSS
ncbi:hypothetical protein ACQPZX_01820 [Actinoplanes sp. CA-142083]|uniref:hypothetical protein n=1 Tax=Actinoplanes sp. CA-142083 TaxID=3239903 RepID=UPI003D8AB370